jgi:RNA polymerase-binding transcription factor DksA
MGTAIRSEQARFRRAVREQALVDCVPMFQEALERERTFRIEQLASLAAAARNRSGRSAESDDSARAEVDVLLACGARRALADIEHALVAIRTGRYGRCEGCDAEIPLDVLRAIPRTRCCPDCHGARADEGRRASGR